MKLNVDHVVSVTLLLTEEEARWLAELCGQIGGPPTARREFYEGVWKEIRGGLMASGGADTYGANKFHVNASGTLCVRGDIAE